MPQDQSLGLKVPYPMDLKHLKALLKLMRENGALSLKTADVDIQLSHDALFPSKTLPTNTQNAVSTENPYANFPDGELTPEQLMFYSAGGDPKDDPENN